MPTAPGLCQAPRVRRRRLVSCIRHLSRPTPARSRDRLTALYCHKVPLDPQPTTSRATVQSHLGFTDLPNQARGVPKLERRHLAWKTDDIPHLKTPRRASWVLTHYQPRRHAIYGTNTSLPRAPPTPGSTAHIGHQQPPGHSPAVP